jgi:hypothetical protein
MNFKLHNSGLKWTLLKPFSEIWYKDPSDLLLHFLHLTFCTTPWINCLNNWTLFNLLDLNSNNLESNIELSFTVEDSMYTLTVNSDLAGCSGSNSLDLYLQVPSLNFSYVTGVVSTPVHTYIYVYTYTFTCSHSLICILDIEYLIFSFIVFIFCLLHIVRFVISWSMHR